MIYLDSITSKTLKTLWQLRDAGLLRGFYLAGGTGLALQVGHRISDDLDFLTDQPSIEIPTGLLHAQCVKHFQGNKLGVLIKSTEQLRLAINGVAVTFLAYPYKHKYPLLNEDGIPLADARDIAFQKALAIGRRETARDYIDLAWILKNGILTLDSLISGASELFNAKEAGSFSPRLFLQQLVCTDNLPDKEAALKQLHTHESFDSITEELVTVVHERSQRLLQSDPEGTNKDGS
ncbi:MAG: nucleotidyl transferase AbiEii/AbiGii toxin family protein [Thermaerobacter sp.]|nr:nucleotidyl transferase AbiEii/AbiGii toxin family protein [Thermaerobacter sp.]